MLAQCQSTDIWPTYIALLNVIENFVYTGIVERWNASQEFIEHNAKAPPIYRFPMRLTFNNFWSYIIRSSDNSCFILILNGFSFSSICLSFNLRLFSLQKYCFFSP